MRRARARQTFPLRFSCATESAELGFLNCSPPCAVAQYTLPLGDGLLG